MSEETKKPTRVYLHPKECKHGFYACGMCHDKAGDLMTDADRITALEAEVARLKALLVFAADGLDDCWCELTPDIARAIKAEAEKFRKEVEGE